MSQHYEFSKATESIVKTEHLCMEPEHIIASFRVGHVWCEIDIDLEDHVRSVICDIVGDKVDMSSLKILRKTIRKTEVASE